MKIIALYLLCLPLFSLAQGSTKPIDLGSIVIGSGKSLSIDQGDSSAIYLIDTLVMHDKARLTFFGKEKVKVVVKYAVVGKKCLLLGNDGKNNGTHLDLSINFAQLQSLHIDVSGVEAKGGNRHHDNGDGGDVTLRYLETGAHPQQVNRKDKGYVTVLNKGAGSLANPQIEMAMVMDRLRNGAPGRPLNQFPNGRVYSGNAGINGKTSMRAIAQLEN